MALRISRRVCTLGRPRALGAGTKGSMWNHSASDKSVWYALLMLGTLPSHYLRTPFRTVSYTGFSETDFRQCRLSEPELVRMEGQAVMIVCGNMVVFLSCLLAWINVNHRHA